MCKKQIWRHRRNTETLSVKQQGLCFKTRTNAEVTVFFIHLNFIRINFNMFVTDIRKEFYDVVVNQVRKLKARLLEAEMLLIFTKYIIVFILTLQLYANDFVLYAIK